MKLMSLLARVSSMVAWAVTPHFTAAVSLPAWLFPSPQSHSEVDTTCHLIGEESHDQKPQTRHSIHCSALLFLLICVVLEFVKKYLAN